MICISLKAYEEYRRTTINPLEFSWTEDQQVTVTNPTSKTYRFKVHNKDYELGAGKTAKMPGYIAWVYVYGLATQLAQADNVFTRWNEEGFRQEYYDQVIVGVDNLVQTVEVQEEPDIHTFDSPEEAANTDTTEVPAGGATFESKYERAAKRGKSATV